MVPKDTVVYPTLGPQICEWIEENLVFGPGDLRGEPYKLDAEKRAFVYRMYEVYPEKHPQAGRRRFKRAALSIRKGTAKTEFAAIIAACELHQDAPVRCDGFDAQGNPVGVGVRDPYIPMLAYTEEQSDELAYNALYVILAYSKVVDDFDLGLERIMRVGGDGKAVSLSSSPNARDGARTTFQVFDETHRWTLPKLIEAHRTMLSNTAKRYLADTWSLEVTTAYAPGENSVAEGTMEHARQINAGEIHDPRMFFFHRQASDGYDLSDEEQLEQAIIEASGPAAGWSDIQAIKSIFLDPNTDLNYAERVWLNRPVRVSDKAFDVEVWKQLVRDDVHPARKAVITLGFDGARWRDSVALVATHLATGYQWLCGIWEKPFNIENWEAPLEEIDATVAMMFEEFKVARMYCDPPYWETLVASWAGKYGEKVVLEWYTTRLKAMGMAIQAYETAIKAREISHGGDEVLTRHIGNAKRKKINIVDEHGNPLYVIYKETADSPFKIDAAMASILSWQAYLDALAAGVDPDGGSVYDKRGILTV